MVPIRKSGVCTERWGCAVKSMLRSVNVNHSQDFWVGQKSDSRQDLVTRLLASNEPLQAEYGTSRYVEVCLDMTQKVCHSTSPNIDHKGIVGEHFVLVLEGHLG